MLVNTVTISSLTGTLQADWARSVIALPLDSTPNLHN